jgi:hypothetical protein
VRRRVGVALVVVLLLASLVVGCVGDCEERYLYFPIGTVVYRCDKLNGDCVAGRAGEEAVYAVLPPEGKSIEEWVAEEGLRLTAGEGR